MANPGESKLGESLRINSRGETAVPGLSSLESFPPASNCPCLVRCLSVLLPRGNGRCPGRKRLALGKHRLDASQCLAGAFFVFDEGEADVAVAIFAEADAGRYGNFGFVEQALGKLERLEISVLFRNLRPDEHGCLGHGYGPAELVEAFDQHVATEAVGLADLPDALLRTLKCGDGGDLNGREGAVVEVTLEAGPWGG